jgi:hypothetical protein
VPTPEHFEFVNRTEELATLRDRVLPIGARGAITFLRSPSGYGKSRLTDRLVEQIPSDGPTCVLVDPAIRSKSRSDRIYGWFFVQRAAEPYARRLVPGRREYRPFADFVRKRGWRRIHWKQVYEHAKAVSSIGGLFKVGFELGENLLKRGRYSPEVLLQDDSRLAAEIAQDYVLALSNFRPTLFVIRETQNIDPESLKFFLSNGTAEGTCCTIFEYTTSDYKFSAEHEKIIFDSMAEPSMVILDLHSLNVREFRYLLNKYAPISKNVEAVAELQWDGNLRIIRELKYRVMVRHAVDAPTSFDLQTAIQKNIVSLTTQRRLILALVVTHVEALDQGVLVTALRRVDSSITEANIASDLKHLAEIDGYIRFEGNRAAIADEDLLAALIASQPMAAVLKLAAISLRDYYLDLVSGDLFGNVPLHSALRQAVALCAKTGDIFALRNLVKILDRSARQAHNQTLYVSIVADAALADRDLSEIEKRELVGWASASAYEAGNFPTAARLLEALIELRSYDMAMLACCYGETNRHEAALELAGKLAGSTHEADRLAAKLIACLSLHAIGRKEEAIALHAEMRQNETFTVSPLFGFVLRFTEVVDDFPDCSADVLASANLLRRAGLRKSAAYSLLSGAMHLAYLGKIKAAQQRVASADRELRPHIRNQSIIINNRVVIELLSGRPKVAWCLDKLTTALFNVGDDFSRLTLHNNCLICYALLVDVERGNHTVSVIDRILDAPGFGNRDIFITVCFNVWRFCVETGQSDKANRFRSIALGVGLENSCYPNYWSVRFGLQSSVEPAFDFLLQHKYHPEYLSHWLIDLEGLNVLRARDGQ